MSDAAMTMAEFEGALDSLSKLLVGTADDLSKTTARAERAEAQLDDVVIALADLLLAVDTRAWPMIQAAVRDANRAMLGTRGQEAAR